MVNDRLNPGGLPEIFVLGDLAHLEQDGRQIPGVAQPAMQMGDHVAKMIAADLAGKPRPPFRYFDKATWRPSAAWTRWPRLNGHSTPTMSGFSRLDHLGSRSTSSSSSAFATAFAVFAAWVGLISRSPAARA